MPAKLINGKEIAQGIKDLIKGEISREQITPGLGVILVSGNAASELYVDLKEKSAKEVGIMLNKYIMGDNCSTEQIIEAIVFLNKDPDTHGIIVQLPLPNHLDTDKIIESIDPKKDVDGFHPKNIEEIEKGNFSIVPVIGKTILSVIEKAGIETKDKHAVILSNSKTFSKPLIPLLELLHCSVEVTRIENSDWINVIQKGDIVITATGKPHIITKDMVKENSLIIDIGFSKEGLKVYGDVDPEVDEKVAFRTPVPGGVGPITVAMLLSNTLSLYKQQIT